MPFSHNCYSAKKINSILGKEDLAKSKQIVGPLTIKIC